MNSKQRAINELEQRIEAMHDKIKVIEMLPDVIDSQISGSGLESIHINVFDWPEFRRVRDALRGMVRPSEPFSVDNDGRNVHPYRFLPANRSLYITLHAGQSCDRVKTGTKEVPIYRLECN